MEELSSLSETCQLEVLGQIWQVSDNDDNSSIVDSKLNCLSS
jgi:50S ribosomal subunit-associated GTPase HflX